MFYHLCMDESEITRITFWDDIPNSILTESCYVAGCWEKTSGGGSDGDTAVTLCSQHRTETDFDVAVEQLKSWKT